ncbi:glycerol-3-phosphate acyltransferase [Octadecabacter temperatus]|uniref:Glycerol-3-phosphate acyltransferase n=1 Tax=Octadecabacter temperatus TaxID=1458307 RepID=A0A0K0Y294_9RHOB|nr:1-acyl-sn-glycerol-3-phosphate acyltransferase [Octadecabacter temperatus]AKS45054.1 Glycerol-3-phosphate acyltransferase [Octadecabacter temperatus]SIN85307.1 glycerol-3-phosphate acyltransferase [Octadecabacter temperatus]
MTTPIEIPLWLLVLVLLFAAVTFASHFLFPSVRWFFRRRAERVVARVNKRLAKPIEPFKLARRYDTIERLVFDPEVIRAVNEYAKVEDVREDVAFEKARHYAREIVPSFSATAYFSFGMRLAKWLSRFLYRLRVGQFDRAEYEAIDPDATVIFVMNHRSNMDYVLVTYLVSRAGALSYAVGEWARVWPLSAMIKMMGGYFIRRKSRSKPAARELYRKVLARYVQMATEGGVTQAVFPEGGLSLNGKMANPRLGILSYIVDGFDPEKRDVVFVPVALNYDRVLEDKFLIKADQTGKRRFRPPLFTVVGGVTGYLWARVRRKLTTFGTANVSFGQPLSLRDFSLSREGATEAVGQELMARIASVVPLLPVPLVSRAILSGATTQAEITASIEETIATVPSSVAKPRRTPDQMATDGLVNLRRRGLVSGDAVMTVADTDKPVLAYYANSISHHYSEE